MRKYTFAVEGLPPKKNGANSMWNKPLEAERLIDLRLAAFKSFNGELPLSKNIKLQLEIMLPNNSRIVGDLDTFITGICDGLMASDLKAFISPKFELPGLNHIHPSRCIGIVDDSEVVSVVANKTVGSPSVYYKVTLEGE